MNNYISSLLIFLFLICSCNNKSQTKSNLNPTKFTHPESKLNKNIKLPTDDISEDLKQFPLIKDIFDKYPCIQNKNCETIAVSGGTPPLRSEQIMILEGFNVPTSSLAMYQDRISGFYSQKPSGLMEQIFPTGSISKPMVEVLNLIKSYNKPFSREAPSFPVNVMATSWATPLALSYIRYARQERDAQSVFNIVMDRILDPIKNKQFIQSVQ